MSHTLEYPGDDIQGLLRDTSQSRVEDIPGMLYNNSQGFFLIWHKVLCESYLTKIAQKYILYICA